MSAEAPPAGGRAAHAPEVFVQSGDCWRRYELKASEEFGAAANANMNTSGWTTLRSCAVRHTSRAVAAADAQHAGGDTN